MERTVNSLAYKGSIPDAINQSRQQKKLFVVYISGEDEASSSLEQSTLVDEQVVEVIGRCCIFLHLKQGNMDAAQFSAIYPQKSIPSISVIGLNGVMLWNHGGHIISENLKERIEKAWAALHLQEPLGKNGKEDSESVSDPGDKTVEKLDSAQTEVKGDLSDSSRNSNKGSSSDPKPYLNTNNKVDGSCVEAPSEASPSTITSRGLSSQLLVEQDKAKTSSAPDEVSNSVKSDDVHLSIRIPSGNRLEIKLTKQDLLKEVKNFVDQNLGSGVGSYDLSMIYPKRVFTVQDMEATLCELGIQNRHAMMVVPHHQSAQVRKPQSSRSIDAGENSGDGGYFSYLRTVLTYANPLSYLRGNPTSNPELQAHEEQQQHRTTSGQWSRPGLESQEATQESRANTLRRRTTPFGANVHTLGSEEQSSSDNENVFWNGNSTEYGGDDKYK